MLKSIMEPAIVEMSSEEKTPHPKLTAYIENVVSRAYSKGLLENNYGAAARFAELLGTDVSRQLVWSWIWVYSGMPRNRINQLKTLNHSLGISMNDEELEELFATKAPKEGAKPAQILFEEVEKSAMESNVQSHVVRKRIADYMGVSSRTLFRYKAEGDIPKTKKVKLKEAISSLNIKVPAEIMAAVFD